MARSLCTYFASLLYLSSCAYSTVGATFLQKKVTGVQVKEEQLEKQLSTPQHVPDDVKQEQHDLQQPRTTSRGSSCATGGSTTCTSTTTSTRTRTSTRDDIHIDQQQAKRVKAEQEQEANIEDPIQPVVTSEVDDDPIQQDSLGDPIQQDSLGAEFGFGSQDYALPASQDALPASLDLEPADRAIGGGGPQRML